MSERVCQKCRGVRPDPQVDPYADHCPECDAGDDRFCPECGEDLDPPCVCGAPMLKRQGKFGLFMGCGTFPKCDFTRSLVAVHQCVDDADVEFRWDRDE